MIHVASFPFNMFQENTYILSDETKECVIFDPGCYTDDERKQLANYIATEDLNPVRLINTHCHLDHVFGNRFVAEKYNLGLEIHEGEIPVLKAASWAAEAYGIKNMQESPKPSAFLTEKDTIQFGNSTLTILFTPGHSPASLSFYSEADKIIIAGDVLFLQSIGRTDLPGGDFNTLINSINTQFLTLPDDVKIFPGHGPATTIGFERVNNSFLMGKV